MAFSLQGMKISSQFLHGRFTSAKTATFLFQLLDESAALAPLLLEPLEMSRPVGFSLWQGWGLCEAANGPAVAWQLKSFAPLQGVQHPSGLSVQFARRERLHV